MKIAIAGASGRMGQMLIRQIAPHRGLHPVRCRRGAASNALGRDAGEVAGVGAKGVKIVSDAATAIGAADVVIDFTCRRPRSPMPGSPPTRAWRW